MRAEILLFTKQHRCWHYTVLLLIVLTAFFLRTYQLNQQALRGDEAATVLYSAMSLGELWELSRVTDPHPPLYYAMLHPWQWLAGESSWAMRFAGAAAGTLAVAALYALVQRTLHSPITGLLAAALLAINPLQIWLAQDVRSYPFFTLLGLLSSLTLWAALHYSNTHPKNISPTAHHSSFIIHHLSLITLWILYVFLTTACFYIHYYTVFLIAFQGLFVLINLKKFWCEKWLWLASQAAIGLLIIPGLQLAYNFLGQAAGGIEKIPAYQILRLASTALLTGFTINDTWGLWISLILVPIWIIGIVSLFKINITAATFWTLFFALPTIGVIALSIDRPFFKERYLIQAQPALELLLATGFLTLWHSRTPRITHYALRITAPIILSMLLYVNILALSNYFFNPVYAKSPPWYLYHDYVSRHSVPDDVMLTNFPEAAVSYYSPNTLPFYVVPVERDRSVAFRLEQTEQIANAYSRIWFLPLLRQGFDEQGDVLNWLDRHADRVKQVFFPVYNINLYLSPAIINELLIEQPVTFAHGINLRGYQVFDEEGESRLELPETGNTSVLRVKPEGEFVLSLYWQASDSTDVPYTVFTHLIAADGFNRTGHDNEPVWGTYPTTAWSPGEKVTDKYTLTIPPGTPTGDHRVRIGWYRPDTQERVYILDAANQPAADHLILDVIIRVE